MVIKNCKALIRLTTSLLRIHFLSLGIKPRVAPMMSAFQAGAIDFSPIEQQHIGYSFIITKLSCPYKDPEVASTSSQE